MSLAVVPGFIPSQREGFTEPGLPDGAGFLLKDLQGNVIGYVPHPNSAEQIYTLTDAFPTRNSQTQLAQTDGTLTWGDHNAIAGLDEGDGHTQYTLLAGRNPAQQLNLGTAEGETGGVISSTAHGTKGRLTVGGAVFDEANGRLGINVTPTCPLDIVSISGSTVVVKIAGAADQVDNLTEWYDSSNNLKAYVTAEGAASFIAPPVLPTFTAGSLLFAGTGGVISEDNANLFWSATNARLGLHTASPAYDVHLEGSHGGHAYLGGGPVSGYDWFEFHSTDTGSSFGGDIVCALNAEDGFQVVKNNLTSLRLTTNSIALYLQPSGGGSISLENGPNALYGYQSTGFWKIGNPATLQAQLNIGAQNTTDKVLVLSGMAAQTASVMEAQDSSGTPYVTIGPPVLPGDSLTTGFLGVTGAFPATLTNNTAGIIANITTTSGAHTQIQQGMVVNLLPGYTGTGKTFAIFATNQLASSGNDLRLGNFGSSPAGATGIYAGATGGSTGLALGGAFEAGGGTALLKIGVMGKSIHTGNANPNIAVAGFGGGSASTVMVGGYFGLHNSTPTFASAALMCDNGAQTSDIFVARDNGTAVFKIIDGGKVGIGITPTATFHLDDANCHIKMSNSVGLQCNTTGGNCWANFGGVGDSSINVLGIYDNSNVLQHKFTPTKLALNLAGSGIVGGTLSVKRATTTTGFTSDDVYVNLGVGEFGVNTTRLIGFGFTNIASGFQPAYIGYIETSISNFTIGDLILGTRSVTTNTQPTERMRITSGGLVGVNISSSIGAQLHVVAGASSTIGQIVQADPSQTANGTEWRNSSGTAYVTVGPPTLPGTNAVNYLRIVGAIPSSLTGNTDAMYLDVTGAGSGGTANCCFRIFYRAGYTGSTVSAGIIISNASGSTGSVLVASTTGNVGLQAITSATTTGLNIGLAGSGAGGNLSVGTSGSALTAKAGGVNIGTSGFARNTSGTGTEFGGYFGLLTSDPTWPVSGALVCNNGASTSNIFRAEDNGTAVFTIADGGNITFTGSLTGTGSIATAMAWSEVTTTQQASVNNGYIANNAVIPAVITLPTTAAVGTWLSLCGKGVGGWRLAQNAGQKVHLGFYDTTAGTGGFLDSTHQYDALQLICTVANTEWTAVGVVGDISVT